MTDCAKRGSEINQNSHAKTGLLICKKMLKIKFVIRENTVAFITTQTTKN